MVRFWEYINGSPVRLSLPSTGGLSWGTSRATEEGWASEAVTWRVEGGEVVRESYSDGRDCDGRLSSESVASCPMARLAGHAHDGILWPEWERVSAGQRDYAAEAAGY